MTMDYIGAGLAAYGYSQDLLGEVYSPKGRPSGVRMRTVKGRFRAELIETTGRNLLFSGPANAESIGRFLEAYWFARKLEVGES